MEIINTQQSRDLGGGAFKCGPLQHRQFMVPDKVLMSREASMLQSSHSATHVKMNTAAIIFWNESGAHGGSEHMGHFVFSSQYCTLHKSHFVSLHVLQNHLLSYVKIQITFFSFNKYEFCFYNLGWKSVVWNNSTDFIQAPVVWLERFWVGRFYWDFI